MLGLWNPGAFGMSGRSPSALLALGRDPSAAGGWVTTRWVRLRPMSGVAALPSTSRTTKSTP
eukprot:4164456-Alexandrium_andersonii.AAC.1